jgi:predicted RNase H-like HicB family nuclease
MQLSIELEREEDGRWIAEALELPGVMAYGVTRDEAVGAVERLAVEVISDRVAHGELPASSFNLSFTVLDEQLAGL